MAPPRIGLTDTDQRIDPNAARLRNLMATTTLRGMPNRSGGTNFLEALTRSNPVNPFAQQGRNASQAFQRTGNVFGQRRGNSISQMLGFGTGGFNGSGSASAGLLGAGSTIFGDQMGANYKPPISSGGGTSGNAQGMEGTAQWQDLLQKAGSESGVPWQVLAAIMGIESGGQNIGTNGAGATGLMQIVGSIWQGTANNYGGDLTDPWTNIRTAADILRMNYDSYGSWEKAAAAYFGGGGAFNADGSYSDNADMYGTDISAYVSRFRDNLASTGYGSSSTAESFSGGQAASAWGRGALEAALSVQGTPYVWGGSGPGGFDCSGLVQWAYGNQGKNFGRTAAEQYSNTIRISGDQLQPGDLIFFDTMGTGGISHVGIYLGNGQMIHAPKENDIVKIVSLEDDFWRGVTRGYGRVG